MLPQILRFAYNFQEFLRKVHFLQRKDVREITTFKTGIEHNTLNRYSNENQDLPVTHLKLSTNLRI